MNTIEKKSKPSTLQGESYKKWHTRYHTTINNCAIKYRNTNKEEINNRARDRFNNNPEYRQKKLDAMKRYREKKKKQKAQLLIEQTKITEENEKSKIELVEKVRDLALERQLLLDKLQKLNE